MLPFFRDYLEPDPSKSLIESLDDKEDQSESTSIFEFIQLLTSKGSRIAFLW